MITKLEQIKNMAVFRDFSWDQSVTKPNGDVAEFSHINILYGRNYSGKTTLSRILRAVETGAISDKYNAPEFKVLFGDGSEINHTNYETNTELVRVFNEDFVRDNLRFMTNPDESVEPFALIGDDNIRLEGEIEVLRNEIGSDDAENETGLMAQLVSKTNNLTAARTAHQRASSSLNGQLVDKATGRENGIKYKSERFGDQNYTKPKLESDIAKVLAEDYVALTDDLFKECENLIAERAKDPIPELADTPLSFAEISREAQTLLNKEVGAVDKIDELVRDAVLNRWVSEGNSFHKEKRENCAFCGNEISEGRWAELDKHFDEESASLEKDIDALLLKVKGERDAVEMGFGISKDLFYTKFHDRLDVLSNDYTRDSQLYTEALDGLTRQLESRKADIINAKNYEEGVDHSETLQLVWAAYEALREESNEFTGLLTTEQTKAKGLLRLQEVHVFASTIKYDELKSNIETLADDSQTKADSKNEVVALIQEKQGLIEGKLREMNDEEKGALKVNEYLTHFFGHQSLSLEAQENEDEGTGVKSVRFEVIRDRRKAFHLSEGECSLLAFCYFLAKLDDTETRGAKPIIWIDDPISSLDANHIFFVYSILFDEVVTKGAFAQLFISTHNLDFLKYLKRLKGKFLNHNQRMQDYGLQFFIVERMLRESAIKLMPEYLREYVTEFNYLFDQIYKCSKIEIVTDENYPIIYNFPNNARKFMEIFLYYKYPHGSRDRHGSIHMESMQRFFGDQLPSVLINRISNEGSHLAGGLERGAIPIDSPEMTKAATIIVDQLRTDEFQFKAFLSSIGEEED